MSQAIVLAGGRGERLRPLTDFVPKPMVDVNGSPFLNRILSQLKCQAVESVIVLGGYKSEIIEDYVRTAWSARNDLSVTVRPSSPSLSPGERLLEAERELETDFLLLYGDNYARFSLERLKQMRISASAKTAVSVTRKSPGNISIDELGTVRAWSKTGREDSLDFVELGYMLVARDYLIKDLKDYDADLSSALRAQALRGVVTSVEIRHPYFSVSDQVRLGKTREALADRKVLILDRDGVLNVKPEQGRYVRNLDEFVPIWKNWEAIRRLTAEGFSFVIATNQAGLETGALQCGELESVHNEICRRFAKMHSPLLGIYVCPHHWDSLCDCRKPKAGLLYQAAIDNNLVLDDLMMVGDQRSDWEAATEAGSRPLLIGETDSSQTAAEEWFPTMLEALPTIRQHYSEGRALGFR